MAVSITNISSAYEAIASTHPISLTGVTAGSTLVLVFCETDTNNRTISSINTNNPSTTALTAAIGKTLRGSAWFVIYYLPNVAAGDHTVTVTLSASATCKGYLLEIANADLTSPLVTTDTNDDGGVASTHYCAQSGNVDTTESDVAVVTMSVANNVSTGAITANASLTKLGFSVSPANGAVAQYGVFATPLTDFRAQWTSLATDRQFGNGIAVFKGSGVAALSVSAQEVSTWVTF